MEKLRRRAAVSVLILAVFMLVTSVCLYVRRDAPRAMGAASVAVSSEQNDPVTQFRTEREQLRSRQTGELNDIIHDSATDAETASLAKRQLMDLMKRQEAEQRLEGILAIRGFEDALVTVSDASVNVILRADALTRRETAVILDLVLRETGVTAGNVKILTINP